MDNLCDPTIWGKRSGLQAAYPLANHMVDTSAAALVLWDRWLRPGLRELLTDALAPGDPAKARLLMAAVAGLHDVGKVSSVFQARTLDERGSAQEKTWALAWQSRDDVRTVFENAGYPVTPPTDALGRPVDGDDKHLAARHEAMSLFQLADGSWPEPHDEVEQLWSAAVAGGHHGVFNPRFDANDYGSASAVSSERARKILRSAVRGPWQAQADKHVTVVLDALGLPEGAHLSRLRGKSSVAVILLTGITCMADHLASGSEAIKVAIKMKDGAAENPTGWLTSRQAYFDRHIDETVGLYHGFEDATTAIIEEWTPSELQKDARRVGDGLWVVTFPTGEGKTAAAMLRHSTRYAEGFIFALPTRATTDAMWTTIQHIFRGDDNAANLIHQFSALNDFYLEGQNTTETSLRPTEWLTDRLHRLFAPVAVSTCDQVLLGILRQKFSPTRLLALANKHVIIDEVHTFDHYQSRLLRELLAWLGETNTRVTLLSATLPQSQLTDYTDAYVGTQVEAEAIYPGHTHIEPSGAVHSVTVPSRREYDLDLKLHDVSAGHLVDQHVMRALRYRKENPNQRIAVIVNRVDRAIEIGAKLMAAGHPVIVLHSRMTQAHREHIGRELVRRLGKKATATDDGLIVVGTQVIEASLDIDFDRMITDLAPTPSLIQRAGRLWRFSTTDNGAWGHKRPRPTDRPVLDILVPTDEDGSIPDDARYPYLLVDLKRSRGAIKAAAGTVHVPSGIQLLVDQSTPTDDDIDFEVDSLDLEAEKSAENIRLGRAAAVAIKMNRGHGSDSVLAENMKFGVLETVTSTDYLTEMQTRFIEEETVTIALYDPHRQRRWAWHGDVADILKLKDPADIRALQAATLPVRVSLFEKITGIDPTLPRENWEPVNRVLTDVWPVSIHTVTYDELLGLRK